MRRHCNRSSLLTCNLRKVCEARPGAPGRAFSCGGVGEPSQRKLYGRGGQEMQFQKGQSGNPAGRPRGSRNGASVLVHSLLENEAEDLARMTIEIAKRGDIA